MEEPGSPLVVIEKDGKKYLESEGLREAWQKVCRPKQRHPEKSLTETPLRPAKERMSKQAKQPASPLRTPEDVPDFYEERARHEQEKRLLAELTRKEKEGELVYRADWEAAIAAIHANLLTSAEALPERIKSEVLPGMTHAEMEKMRRIINSVFEAVASHDFEELGQ